jgi:hypothetical protein
MIKSLETKLSKRKRPVFFILFILLVFKLGANETKDGYIKMLIDEKTGRYSLSFLTDPSNAKYSQLFFRNSNTSFLDINVDGVYYRLGSSHIFKTRVDRENEEPVVFYESSFLTVKESFAPVKTISSPNANGIRITIKIINKDEAEPAVGLRMLVDTNLGEGRKNIPFVTENINIINEKIIESSSEEKYWISRGKDIALMGSIADPLDETAKRPDYLHFANWKKLSDVPWKASYHEGRSFNNLPYSIGDSAVSYYWEPGVLEMGGTFTYTVYLTTEDTAWYYPEQYVQPVRPVPPAPAPEIIPEIAIEPVVIAEPQEQADQSAYNMALIEKEARELSLATNEDFNIIILRLLQNILNQFIAGEISLNELDILQIDLAIERYGQKQE